MTNLYKGNYYCTSHSLVTIPVALPVPVSQTNPKPAQWCSPRSSRRIRYKNANKKLAWYAHCKETIRRKSVDPIFVPQEIQEPVIELRFKIRHI